MPETHQQTLSIGDIRSMLVETIKEWDLMTRNLSWPEDDNSLAEMDTHVLNLKTVRGHLTLVENNLPVKEQRTLAARFQESSIQDPHKFAPFAKAVKLAVAA